MGHCNAGSSYFMADHLGLIYRCQCLRQIEANPIGDIDTFQPLWFEDAVCDRFKTCATDYQSDWLRTIHDDHPEKQSLPGKTIIRIHPSGMRHFPRQERESFIRAKKNHLDVNRWIDFIQRIKQFCFPCYFIIGSPIDEPTLYDLNLEQSMEGHGGSLFKICQEAIKGPGYLKLVSDFSNGVIVDEISRIAARPRMKFSAIMHPNESDFDFNKFLGRVLMVRHRGFHIEVIISGMNTQMFIFDYWKSFWNKYQIETKVLWETPGKTSRMSFLGQISEMINATTHP